MAKPIELVELSSRGCEHCENFRKFWHSIEKDWPNVKFRDVDLATPEGEEMLMRYMTLASPGIILNSELFSTGPVNQQEFLDKLKELSE